MQQRAPGVHAARALRHPVVESRVMNRTALLMLLCAGCVTTSTHEKAIADLDKQHQEEMDKTKAELEKKLADSEAARKDLEAKLADAQKRADELTKLLQGSAA